VLLMTYPPRLADEVMPGLWLGGSWLPSPPSPAYDLVYTCCWPEETTDDPPARKCLALPFADLDAVDGPRVTALVEAVTDSTARGFQTLVRCHAGLNRATLIAALVILRLQHGNDPRAVIEQLRAVRSPDVLHNRVFEAYLLSTAPVALRPEIRLYDHQTGPFQDGHRQIKHTYVAGVIQYDDIPL
jgi:hypothetical protein